MQVATAFVSLKLENKMVMFAGWQNEGLVAGLLTHQFHNPILNSQIGCLSS